MILLDFAKTFDTVLHERLLLKAKCYGISGNLNNWLGLCSLEEENVWW